MEMCPYCGEDVPSDAPTCWKCGTEISHAEDGEGVAPEDQIELRGGEKDADEEKKKRKGPPKIVCPFCSHPQPITNLRCNRCGQPFKKVVAKRDASPMITAAFVLVVVAVVGGLLYSYILQRRAAADPGRDSPLAVSYPNLARIYLRKAQGAQESMRQDTWYSDHVGHYVEWDGVITKVVDPVRGVVELSSSASARVDQSEVRLTFKDATTVQRLDLKAGKSLRYSARLQEYLPDVGLFTLDNAIVLDD